MRGITALLVGVIIGLIGGGLLVAASMLAGDITIDTQVSTEDSQIITMLYEGLNLETYSLYSNKNIVALFFKTGGPDFCGTKIVKLQEGSEVVSKWTDIGGCDYSNYGNTSIWELHNFWNLTKKLAARDFQDYARIWGLSIKTEQGKIMITKTGMKSAGSPSLTTTMKFEWKTKPDMATLLTTLKGAFGNLDTFDLGDGCILHNGTIEYEGNDYEANIVTCT